MELRHVSPQTTAWPGLAWPVPLITSSEHCARCFMCPVLRVQSAKREGTLNSLTLTYHSAPPLAEQSTEEFTLKFFPSRTDLPVTHSCVLYELS